MQTSDFDYYLPPELIAQTPLEPRDSSRLLVYNRKTDEITHCHFYDIGNFLEPGDLLIRNQTRVLPARIYAKKHETGGKAEILLLRRIEPDTWEALVGGKRLHEGTILDLEEGLSAEIVQDLDNSRRLIRFTGPFEDFMQKNGQMPLPPYIHKRLKDPERYQTVYSRQDLAGSAAAPTAGLHFTEELMQKLEARQIHFADVTLHVGLDTFQPVSEADPQTHRIHKEWCELSADTAKKITETRTNGHRIVAVGTTSARTLESAAQAALKAGSPDCVIPISGDTGIYILPGYEFRAVDAMITNFHLPKSTLIMMISAFTSREKILSVYQQAIDMKYRFFSFGDAMLIL
ncbi:MAG TPA: tRNA preQ1(34) S-adenosylmethionine ribosyltransferase-isomerase QueA [Flexilinea sp.]|jgi:S-adenosylmethionine:tRNA ribosyltransferase-isomerase|nr:tRNA preQ1(34) S-adenosylmethionine ribosyltransferase-isomerase QueA [Flexilinea sp.]HPL57212.1 tRNA preQ1(34) S-adenosylmethionine ribosyltransferase-isomerase QueA [Flexilinea sp.]HQF79638.1 tRNA preQ1(34) S-adenosylmethionine ribosyltransferase-isomerase QueA [Flexilinea sp.]HQG88270.1 tRNA preQ1(34) S-adenosylmethionine ribosyltransferase-isomerase QueA [Flexilinea sp.]